MKKIWKENGLSIVFFAMFLISLTGQFFTGWKDHNNDLEQDHQPPISLSTYINSGHFIQATFENWESEFLQMGLFVIFAVSLRQKGSSESKAIDKKEEVDREPNPRRKGAPWPVKKGGFILKIYNYSLSLAFTFLFILSFVLHFYGSLKENNDDALHNNMPSLSAYEYFGNARFWFESLQNWQSEFLSVFAIVVLSIFLRQHGSPQSKPVDAADSDTGD